MAVDSLKLWGFKHLVLPSLCSLKGQKALQLADVEIFTAALDEEREHGYIVPDLGDAGDRLVGTNRF